MVSEAQKDLEEMFNSEHIINNPYYNKKTGNWHIKMSNGLKLRTKDLLYVLTWIDHLNEEEVEWEW